MHDEAEIRGHRRTYIGALPGNIIQNLRKAGTRNAVMMLDEVDKLGAGGFHGDPASALLEVLDPEQNSTFRDNYLAVPYDLSKVMFICTANVLDTIPGPLRDRMEVIQLPGYTARGEAADRAPLPACRASSRRPASRAEQCEISDDALMAIIDDYTREAGVRNLEREIGSVCRNVAVRIAEGSDRAHDGRAPATCTRSSAPKRFEAEVAMRTGIPGVATGLAWTPVGGDILFIEAARTPGSGQLILTGQLGDVMKESAQAALSLVKARAAPLGIATESLDASTSPTSTSTCRPARRRRTGRAPASRCSSRSTSLLSDRPVRSDVAMTGEISLRGLVLPIGGVKEKVLAALRAGITTVMLPARNRRDLEDIPADAREQLRFVWLEHVDDALRVALEPARCRGRQRSPPDRRHAAELPRLRSFDCSLALLADPYRFIGERCRELDSDVFEARLMLQPTIFLHGAEAAELFYDAERFQRSGAAPEPLRATLFGKGTVQSLDGAMHRQRKALFVAATTPASIDALVAETRRAWQQVVPKSPGIGPVSLYALAREALTRAVCAWAGVPLAENEVALRTRQLSLLFDGAAGGPVQHLRSRLARRRAEEWLARLIESARSAGAALAAGGHRATGRGPPRRRRPADGAAHRRRRAAQPAAADGRDLGLHRLRGACAARALRPGARACAPAATASSSTRSCRKCAASIRSFRRWWRARGASSSGAGTAFRPDGGRCSTCSAPTTMRAAGKRPRSSAPSASSTSSRGRSASFPRAAARSRATIVAPAKASRAR